MIHRPSDDELANIVDFICKDNAGFFYNSGTGRLYRVTEIATSREKEGRIASKSITFHGKQRPSTHLIFFLMTGRFPTEGMVIDHKDRNPDNNEWENLREATHAQNMYNKGDPGRHVNTELDLARGVSKIGNRFRVILNGQSFGSYETLEEANRIARVKRQELQGEFAYNGPN